MLLDRILAKLKEHGALPANEELESALLEPAPADGFPDHFFSTTNLLTWVRLDGRWIEVELSEMDCGIRVDLETMRHNAFRSTRVRRRGRKICLQRDRDWGFDRTQ